MKLCPRVKHRSMSLVLSKGANPQDRLGVVQETVFPRDNVTKQLFRWMVSLLPHLSQVQFNISFTNSKKEILSLTTSPLNTNHKLSKIGIPLFKIKFFNMRVNRNFKKEIRLFKLSSLNKPKKIQNNKLFSLKYKIKREIQLFNQLIAKSNRL